MADIDSSQTLTLRSNDHASDAEGRAVMLCNSMILRLYALSANENVRSRLRVFALLSEGGAAYSLTIREIFRRFHNVQVGLFTAEPCRMRPNVFHSGTIIGRYCSISNTVRTFTRNHPMNTRSTHGFFYNPALGKVKGGPICFNSLRIGNGVSIGHNAIILHPARNIGDGAVISPGSVVSTDVPPYALVSGFPARVTGFRYDKGIVESLLASKWWEKSPRELEATSELLESLLATKSPEARHCHRDSADAARTQQTRVP